MLKSFKHFHEVVNYPMLFDILARNWEAVELGDFKFKKPYLKMIEQAENQARGDFNRTSPYF